MLKSNSRLQTLILRMIFLYQSNQKLKEESSHPKTSETVTGLVPKIPTLSMQTPNLMDKNASILTLWKQQISLMNQMK
jgi:hypothetical protein